MLNSNNDDGSSKMDDNNKLGFAGVVLMWAIVLGVVIAIVVGCAWLVRTVF